MFQGDSEQRGFLFSMDRGWCIGNILFICIGAESEGGVDDDCIKRWLAASATSSLLGTPFFERSKSLSDVLDQSHGDLFCCFMKRNGYRDNLDKMIVRPRCPRSCSFSKSTSLPRRPAAQKTHQARKRHAEENVCISKHAIALPYRLAHACARTSAATPGNSRPSSHSRNAPPAIET